MITRKEQFEIPQELTNDIVKTAAKGGTFDLPNIGKLKVTPKGNKIKLVIEDEIDSIEDIKILVGKITNAWVKLKKSLK